MTSNGQRAARRSRTLREEFGDWYAGRTALVTGADGFMGSHLTEALVDLGAHVHALRAGDLQRRAQQHRASEGRRPCALGGPQRPPFRRPCPSWSCHGRRIDHTCSISARRRTSVRVLAPAVRDRDGEYRGTLNLLQSIISNGVELEKFDTAGTSEEYGNPTTTSATTTTGTPRTGC